MKKFFLTIALLVAVLVSKAQSDYYITAKNDTVFGELKTTSDDWIKFKEKDQSKFAKIPSTDLSRVYDSPNNKIYVYKDVDGKLMLLQLVEEGKINLYERRTYHYSQYGSTTNVNWFAEKNGSPIVEIKTNSFWGSKEKRKNAFTNLIADKPEIMDEFTNEEKFSFKFLQNLIKKYNSVLQV